MLLLLVVLVVHEFKMGNLYHQCQAAVDAAFDAAANANNKSSHDKHCCNEEMPQVVATSAWMVHRPWWSICLQEERQ